VVCIANKKSIAKRFSEKSALEAKYLDIRVLDNISDLVIWRIADFKAINNLCIAKAIMAQSCKI